MSKSHLLVGSLLLLAACTESTNPGGRIGADAQTRDLDAAPIPDPDVRIIDAGPDLPPSDRPSLDLGDASLDGRDIMDAGDGLDEGLANDLGDSGAIIPARTMWVALGGESRLAVVTLSASGDLEERPQESLSLPGSPSTLAYSRLNQRLYVGIEFENETAGITTVSINPNRTLNLIGTTPMNDLPVYLSVAGPDDRWLVSAFFFTNHLRTFDTQTNIPHPQVSEVEVSEQPHAAEPHLGRIYVPHRVGDITEWYDLLPTGILSLAGALPSENEAWPRHIVFNSAGTYAYVINENSDSVTSHRVVGGALEALETEFALPEATDGTTNTAADIHITPDDRFVYASQRGENVIAILEVQANGTLNFVDAVPTEARPREFTISPDGQFLVVAGRDTDAIQSYRIETNGQLTPIARLELGSDPRWIIID